VPSALITQVENVEDAIAAYRAFDRREPGWLKVELAPARTDAAQSHRRECRPTVAGRSGASERMTAAAAEHSGFAQLDEAGPNRCQLKIMVVLGNQLAKLVTQRRVQGASRQLR
jgi:hypothetical protein